MKAHLLYVFVLAILMTGCRSPEKTKSASNSGDAEIADASIASTDSIEAEPSQIEDAFVSETGERITVPVSEEVLNRYAGDYELLLDPSNLFTVSTDQTHLYFTGLQGKTVQFYAENDTSFFNDPQSTETLSFIKRGEYYNMILTNSQGYVLEARRLP